MKARQRTAALLEVLGIYLAGQLVTGQLIRLLGLRPANPLASLGVEVTDAELITTTWQLFVLLTLQYAVGTGRRFRLRGGCDGRTRRRSRGCGQAQAAR
jgi:hypothetical protein